MTLPPRQAPPRPVHLALLLMLLAVAAALRCYHLGANSLWLDEYFSLECSSGWGRTDLRLVDAPSPAPDLISLHNARPWRQIIPSVARDENHPPLFFLMLRGWRTRFGDSPAALRSVAVLGSLLCIVMIFAIGLTIWNPAAALTACTLATFAWPQIQRAQDARAYPWRDLCLLIAVWGLVRLERLGISRLRLLALAGGAFLAPLLHYSAFATLAAMLGYVIFGMTRRPRPPSRAALLALAAAAGLYGILWFPTVVAQRQNMIHATAWLADDPAGHLRVTFYRLAMQPVRFFVEPGGDRQSAAVVWAGLVGLLAPAALLRVDRRLLLWWLWIVVPIGFELFLDLHYHRASLGDMKYTLAAAAGAYLLVGIAAAAVPKWGWSIPAAIVLAELLCLPNVYGTDRPDWRPFTQYIRQNTRPTDPLLIIDHAEVGWPAGYWLLGLQYQLGTTHPVYLLSHVPTPAQVQQFAAAQPTPPAHVCMVGSEDDGFQLQVLPPARIVGRSLYFNLAVVTNVATNTPTNSTAAPFQTPPHPLPSATFP